MVRAARVLLIAILALGSTGLTAATTLAANPPTVGSANVFPVVQGGTYPLGDVTIIEGVPGQLPVGDVLTYRFADAASAASLHFKTTPVISGSNGLSAAHWIPRTALRSRDECPPVCELTMKGIPARQDASIPSGATRVWNPWQCTMS